LRLPSTGSNVTPSPCPQKEQRCNRTRSSVRGQCTISVAARSPSVAAGATDILTGREMNSCLLMVSSPCTFRAAYRSTADSGRQSFSSALDDLCGKNGVRSVIVRKVCRVDHFPAQRDGASTPSSPPRPLSNDQVGDGVSVSLHRLRPRWFAGSPQKGASPLTRLARRMHDPRSGGY